jgi:dihydroorotate dehydrogenase electron transfer subunit
MPEFQEKATVRQSTLLAPDIYRLIVIAPRVAAAAFPGQFVMVRSSSGLDPLLRRPFSIHQVLAGQEIHLLYKVVGRGTELFSRLQVGDTVDLLGPLGRGFPLPANGPVCLVGGGMGIAPLTFLARELVKRRRDASGDVVLLGARTAAELTPLISDFKALGLRVQTATDDGGLGHHGYVTDLLSMVVKGMAQTFVCGPHAMMGIAATMCRDAGTPCFVSLETHMACGLGACLGCTVFAADGTYRHVCKHGPVFPAEEIAWTLPQP